MTDDDAVMKSIELASGAHAASQSTSDRPTATSPPAKMAPHDCRKCARGGRGARACPSPAHRLLVLASRSTRVCVRVVVHCVTASARGSWRRARAVS